jgi:hypothetical protein
MNLAMKPLSEVTKRAVDVLSKEIGIADTVRFLNQFSAGYGDYTKERGTLFEDLTLEETLSATRGAGRGHVPDKRVRRAARKRDRLAARK